MFEIQINRMGVWYGLINNIGSLGQATDMVCAIQARDRITGDDVNYFYRIVRSD